MTTTFATATVDWGGRPRGQGRRSCGQVVGGMSAAPTGRRVTLRYRPALREYVGLHLARGVVVVAGTGRGPVNVLVELEDGRQVVVPRGQLFKEEV